MMNVYRAPRVLAALAVVALTGPLFAGPVRLDDRRELFVDGRVIERLDGARLVLHRPVAREVVFRFDRPWEGVYSAYITVLHDGEKYRMYYRGMPIAEHSFKSETTCYAESPDGIAWTRPELGLFEVHGTRKNNVVLARHRACHNFAPFLDANPDAPADQRFKAVGGTGRPGLVALVSADGIRWRDLREQPIITAGAFDSQNVAFWSTTEKRYVCYFRVFHRGKRWISRATSEDFVEWSEPVMMRVGEKPLQHLYTNQTIPYFRAPHIYLGFPTRFMPGRQALSRERAREIGTPSEWDFVSDCADIMLTSTRGGDDLDRTFLEAFIRPGLDPRNWTSRANYTAHGIGHTAPGELSMWVGHNIGYPTTHVRRYTLRVDGFVSVSAGFPGGELISRVIAFDGDRLEINYATSAAGAVRVELQDEKGNPIAGHTLDDCPPIFGDQISRLVRWKSGPDVGALRGKPVRLRVELKDADLYSFRFLDAPGD